MNQWAFAVVSQDRIHDKYCWKCCRKETTLKCSTCPRSFHSVCEIDENITSEEDWSCCSVCNKLKTSRNKEGELKRIPTIFYRIYNSKFIDSIRENRKGSKRIKLCAESDDSDDIVNAIDLMQIKGKVDANQYTSLDEFLADFQWLTHNYEVLFTENDEKTKRAQKVLKNVSAEIDSVRICLSCHINANSRATKSRWFSMVCHPPHLIIWAQKKNVRYWPGKVMSYDEQQVNVRFFGGYHKHAVVPVKRCFLYSKNSPIKTNHPNKIHDTEFKSAIKEADQYIINIREKYGAFQLAETKTKFEPAKYKEYINELISAIRNNFEENTAQSGEEFEQSNNPSPSMKREPSISIEISDASLGDSSIEQSDNDEEDIDALSDYQKSLQHFERIFRHTSDLEERVKSLEDTNTKLIHENAELKHQIETLKEAHNQEVAQLKKDYRDLIAKHLENTKKELNALQNSIHE